MHKREYSEWARWLRKTNQGSTISVFHPSPGRQVRFRGYTIVHTSASRATPSRQKIAIAKVAGAKLMAVEKPMHSTMVFSGVRLHRRESHPRIKKSFSRADLERSPDKRRSPQL